MYMEDSGGSVGKGGEKGELLRDEED
jgi:hypothetical protein